MRDIMKRAEEGKALLEKHRRADLTISEVNKLYEIYEDRESLFGGVTGLIKTAFEFGVSVGARLK